MPFIGNQPALSYTSFAKQDFTTSATTSYTLDNPVANANELALFINFVRQEPTTAYSASGTTLTLTSATSSSDDMYCVYLGKAVQTVNPPNASVGTSQLADNGVTTAKITDANITSAKLANETGQLRFIASTDTSTTMATQNVFYKTIWNEQLIDNFNEFSPTDYRFTASEAGTYLFYCSCSFRLNSDQDIGFVAFYKNGSASSNTDVYKHIMGSNAAEGYFTVAYKVALAVNDYIEIYSKWTSIGTNRGFNSGAGTGEAIWTGYKIL